MSALHIIEDACEKAKENGVAIIRGATFDRTSPRLRCSGLGAVLWVNALVDDPHPWPSLCRILDEGSFFLYRWTIGWDNWHVLSIYDLNKDGSMVEVGKDEVSAQARSLSRRFTRERNKKP